MKKQITRNQQGVAHLMLVVVAAVVIAIVAFAAIKVAGSNKSSGGSSNSSTASTKAIEDSCQSTYHDSTLCKFAGFSQDFDKTAYTATLNVTQDGTSSSMTLKHDAKGNTALDGSGGGYNFSSIELDGTTYVKTAGTDTWISYPASTSADTTGVSDPTSNLNIAVGASGLTFKSLGTEACGSLTCYKYQISDKATPSATQYIWFDNKDYKLREWKYSDGGNSTDMNVSYDAVNITKPSPVQSFTQ